MYRISIVRIVPNPNYDPLEARKASDMNHYQWNAADPSKTNPTIEDKALTVDLTDEEFVAIKKAVLETM